MQGQRGLELARWPVRTSPTSSCSTWTSPTCWTTRCCAACGRTQPRGGDRRVADVGVDLHHEIAADDHRLALRMVDVGGDDRTPAGDLGADELGGDVLPERDDAIWLNAAEATARWHN